MGSCMCAILLIGYKVYSCKLLCHFQHRKTEAKKELIFSRCALLNNLNFQRAMQVHQGCRPSEQVKVSFESSPCEQSMNSECITVILPWLGLKKHYYILPVQHKFSVHSLSENISASVTCALLIYTVVSIPDGKFRKMKPMQKFL